MTPKDIIEYCQKKGIILQVEGEHLRFNAPTGALTTDIRNLLKKNKAALVDFLQEQTGHPLTGETKLRPRPNQTPVPPSFAQERFWFLQQLDTKSTAYLIPRAFRLRGELNAWALEQSLNALVARHESLRTIFPAIDGTPIQVILPSLTLPLSRLPEPLSAKSQPDLAIHQHVQREASIPFDLTVGPLLRASLLPLSAEDHVFFLTLHHIISDGWSNGILLRELGLGYRAFCEGTPVEFPALPIQYADYAVWQRQWLHGTRLEQELRFWESQLAGAPILCLPTDQPRQAQYTLNGTEQTFILSSTLTQELQSLSRDEGCTLFMTLLAAFQTLLHRYTRQADVVAGSPIAGRTQPELEDAVGLFLNTLVLRTQFLGSPTFREVLQQVSEISLDAYAHQLVPFEQLLQHLNLDRNPSYPPLFQVLFVFPDMHDPKLTLTGLKVIPVKTNRVGAMVDITLYMAEEHEHLRGWLEYNTDLFEASTIKRMLGHFETLLTSLVTTPNHRVLDLPLLTAPERQQLLWEWNTTEACPPSPVTIVHLFEQHVAQTPEAIAVVCADEQLSYAALNAKANQLAHHLQRRGVGPDTRVGLCLERSMDVLIGLWGILKAGGAYVPLDPTYPLARLAFLLQDAAIEVLVSTAATSQSLPSRHGLTLVALDRDKPTLAREAVTNLPPTVTAEHLAYLIYTSGSTGRPKGVMISHGALSNYVETAGRNLAFGPLDRVLQFASINFDASAEEIFPCLTGGGTLVLRPDTLLDSWAGMLTYSETMQLTVLDLPTAVWHELVAHLAGDGRRWPVAIRLLIIGGEPARADRLAQWHQFRHNTVHLLNTYGPTEGTIVALTQHLMPPASPGPTPPTDVPLGRVIPHVQAYVVDPAGHPVPIGVTGECLLGGRGLARGYLKSPGLTATKFQPDPFGAVPGARLYRTGDLMRYRADGILHFVGRADAQVKLRGFRIELTEIEAALTQQPTIQEAVVLCRAEAAGEPQLVAYVVPAAPAAFDLPTVRAALKAHLPAYMVPAAFVVLEELPLTPNGKVDRRALPAPDPRHRGPVATFTTPRTPMEELVATVWQDVLRMEQVGIHDNFFELGGHSLLATQVISRVRTLTTTEVALRTLFDGPTIAQLAKTLETQQQSTANVSPPLCCQPHEGPLPLSFAQQRLWFLAQLEPESPAYLMPYAWHVRGALDRVALEASLTRLMGRQASLRTSFPTVHEQPVQVIAPVTTFNLAYRDLSQLSGATQEATLRRVLEHERQHPMNLATGPLWRAQLLAFGPEDHVFLLTLHHIITDGWSMLIFFRELHALYTDQVTHQALPLAPLPVLYPDYAVWQRQWLVGEVLDRQLAYWRTQLAGAPASLELPMARPRPPRQTFRGANHSFTLPAPLTHLIQQRSQEAGVTVFMTLLATFSVLLFRYTGQRDLLIGTPISGRTHREVEDLIGFFVNTLVLRLQVTDQLTFLDVLRLVRATCLEAYAHQDVPFEKLVEVLKPVRDPSRHPLFQVMFQLHHAEPHGGLRLPPLAVTSITPNAASARFDLWLGFVLHEGTLTGTLTFNTDLFEASSIAAFVGHYHTLLAGLVTDNTRAITQQPLLTEAERQQVLIEWNPAPPPSSPFTSLQELFEEQVARTPEAIALIAQTEHLTYARLNQRANQLAHYLRRAGVGPEVRVGVCLERSVDLLVSLWAILKADGVYVPLDPQYPPARLTFMLEDARVACMVTTAQVQETVLPTEATQLIVLDTLAAQLMRESSATPPRHSHPHQLAYLIYTSGSSGRPKGVMVAQHGLANVAREQQWHFHSGPPSRVLQLASISFDASLAEMIMALAVGGTLILEAREALRPGLPLLTTLRQHAITLATFPPSLLTVMPSEDLPALTTVLVAGEHCPDSVIESWSPGRRFLNLYGPTEATIWSTAATFPGPEPLPTSLGQPIAQTTLYLLDAHGTPVPLGLPGEATLGGIGLARGYLQHPALTAQQFVPDPFSPTPGARLYKTGDRVRYLGAQRLGYLGRLDHQVKLRGYRIEVGEIEMRLREHPAVQDAVVLCREDTPGAKQLVAYVVVTPQGTLRTSTMREALQLLLPDYMIPTAFVVLDQLPLTPNGKIDRQALPAPDPTHRLSSGAYEPPRTPTEELLVAIWQEVLGIAPVGIHDNFFDLGGHSLLATQVIARLNQQVQMDLPLHTVFDYPILADQARTIEDLLLQEMVPLSTTDHNQHQNMPSF